MGRCTSGKHPFAKEVRITKGVKKRQQQTKLALRSVIHIMDFSRSNCYFWFCICNYRWTSCCGNGFEFKGILEKRDALLLLGKTFAHKLTGVGDVNGRTPFRGIWLRCVTNQALNCVCEGKLRPLGSHMNNDRHAHSVSLSLWLIRIQSHPHPNRTLTNKPTCTPNRSWAYLLEEIISYWQPVRFGCQCFPHGNLPELIIS